jgi:hypothetical protein
MHKFFDVLFKDTEEQVRRNLEAPLLESLG